MISVKNMLDNKGRDVITVGRNVTIGEAARTLHEKRIGAVVVIDALGGIAGIFTERDLVTVIARHGADALDKPVTAGMTTNVHRCHEESTVNDLMELMSSRRFRHVPVEKDGKLAGIVSIGDVVKSRIREVELETEQIKAYIAG